MKSKPKLLVISHVLPYPGNAGQQQRVAYTLKAARTRFETHFLTYAEPAAVQETSIKLLPFCDQAIVLESAVRGLWGRAANRCSALAFMTWTGLKTSNYTVGFKQFTQPRLLAKLVPQDYDCVLYEYFHASPSASLFREHGVPTVVDTHNVLWKAMEQRLAENHRLPGWFKRFQLTRYRRQEERAWACFDGLIAINREEQEMIRSQLRREQKLFYAPMGSDLSVWPYCWQPAAPPRLAYYGGLGNRHNQTDALRCHDQIMPRVWKQFPDAEFWIVGSNPPASIRQLTVDSRVKVTGFIQNVQEVLKTMSLVLCPWSGTYGFRSRIVETMALGVPVVATPEAVTGMELDSGHGIILERTDDALAGRAVELLGSAEQLAGQSRLARAAMEQLYGLENTYGRFMNELYDWLEKRGKV